MQLLGTLLETTQVLMVILTLTAIYLWLLRTGPEVLPSKGSLTPKGLDWIRTGLCPSVGLE